MKRVAYLSAVLAVLVFSGCSSKEPAIDATANSSVGGSGSSNGASNGQTSGTDGSAVITPITNASSVDNSAANGSSGAVNAQIVNVYFDYDKFDIREDMMASVKGNAALLKNKTFKLEGNCDEFGSDEYNFALGLKRANAVKTALVNEGITAESISMVSLGEGNPACTEKTQECWAKNRRVEVKLP
ncbi:MAG: OmpA family protein [Sulfuricurvum sp.]|jgi:peptidoglycan-associated lipoprotein|nr:OmpA family protein [Sulfuricurvum sp.]